MKFFTPDWWASGSQDAEKVFQAYEEHFSSIEGSLPQPLIELYRDHTLHDSEVKRIECDFSRRTVLMSLNGWDANLETKVRYVLQFSDVVQFEQKLPQDEYVESELGDLGYWECAVAGRDVLVNMLFVSSAEFRIVFQGFSFSHERVAGGELGGE